VNWAQEYDRRVASGAPIRAAGDLGNFQVQDDAGNWFHRAPGNIDCPCGRDAAGRRVDPFVAVGRADDGEMIDGHYVPFWRMSEFLAERQVAAEVVLAEQARAAATVPEPAPTLYLVAKPDPPGPTRADQAARAS